MAAKKLKMEFLQQSAELEMVPGLELDERPVSGGVGGDERGGSGVRVVWELSRASHKRQVPRNDVVECGW